MSDRRDTTTPHGAERQRAIDKAWADYKAALALEADARTERERLDAIVRRAEYNGQQARQKAENAAEEAWNIAEAAAVEARRVRKESDHNVIQEVMALLKAEHVANHGEKRGSLARPALSDCEHRTCRLIALRESY